MGVISTWCSRRAWDAQRRPSWWGRRWVPAARPAPGTPCGNLPPSRRYAGGRACEEGVGSGGRCIASESRRAQPSRSAPSSTCSPRRHGRVKDKPRITRIDTDQERLGSGRQRRSRRPPSAACGWDTRSACKRRVIGCRLHAASRVPSARGARSTRTPLPRPSLLPSVLRVRKPGRTGDQTYVRVVRVVRGRGIRSVFIRVIRGYVR